MGGQINYNREMERMAERHRAAGEVPTLLLHSCCGPCSTSVMERLTEFFKVTVFYYNPNIYPEEEYAHRVAEQERLISLFPQVHPISFLAGEYDPQEFYEIAREYENLPEGGERCFRCYELRLRKTAQMAAAGGFDYFTTTLTVSPLKNAQKLNEIGEKVAEEISGTAWLLSDFKKKNGYLRSCELSREFGMYRQDYCGCVYSLRRDHVGLNHHRTESSEDVPAVKTDS